jgi:nicotinate-nucleotide adenylyltransferase
MNNEDLQGLNVYFGGSFDPPHLGHHEIVKALLRDAWSYRVHLVPTAQNPLKNKQSLGSQSQRKEWIETWVRELHEEEPSLAKKKLSLELVELESGTTTYTIDTLSRLMNEARDLRPWALALGADIAGELVRWKNIDELLSKLHSLWIFARGDRESEQDIMAQLDPGLRGLTQFRIMSDRICEISSTRLRENLVNCLSDTSRGAELEHLVPSLRAKIRSR